jgi:hypothetical protein
MAADSNELAVNARNLYLEAAFVEMAHIVAPGLVRRKPRGAREMSLLRLMVIVGLRPVSNGPRAPHSGPQ